MMPFVERLTIPALSVGCLICLHPNGLAQSADGKLLLRGTVSDRQGNPIEGATISWMPTGAASGVIPLTSTVFPACTTSENGSFSMSPSLGDLRALVQRDRGQGRAILSKPGFSTAIIDVSLNRMLSGAPLSIELDTVLEQPMTVLDSDGEPLRQVTVSPATLDGQTLPFFLLPQHRSITDDHGQVVLPGVQAGRLSHVYLQSQPHGVQRVEVQWSEDGARVQAIPLLTYSGQLTAPAEAEVDLSQVKLLFKVIEKPRDTAEQCLWESAVDADGRFEALISQGTVVSAAILPSDWPYSIDLYQQTQSIDHDQRHIPLQLEPAVLVAGQIIDEATQQGIPGVAIRHASQDLRPSVTGDDGRFTFWSVSNSHDFYPWDPSGDFVFQQAFYHRPQQAPQANRVEVPPLAMVACHPGLGRVVDQQGNPISGARIECAFKSNRFNQTATLFSREDGTFRFQSIPPKSVVDLTVRAGRFGTEQPVSVRLRRTPDVEVVVKPLSAAYFTGSVHDPDGRPIANAMVTIRKANVFEEEMVGWRDRQAANLFDNLCFFTDSTGHYRSEVTVDWDQDTSVEINAAGYETYFSHWSTRKPSGSDSEQISLELATLTPAARPRKIRVSVVDPLGDTIDSYRVVFLGAKSGHVKRTVLSDADAHFTLLDSPQIAAVIADGFLPDVKIIRQLPSEEISFQLQSLSSSPPHRNSKVLTDEQIRDYMVKLLGMLPEPPQAGSLAQRASYYSIYSSTNPAELVTRIKNGEIIGGRMDYLQAFGVEISRMPSQEILRLLPDVNHQMRVGLNVELAKRTHPSDESQRYLSDALIAVSETGGDERLIGTAQIVCTMLELGMPDLARQILEDCLQDNQELTSLLENSTRSEDRLRPGVARIFAPVHAMIDLKSSFRLIELAAFANEIDMLQSTAVAFSLATGGPWEECYEQLGKDRFVTRGLVWYYYMFRFVDAESALKLASLGSNLPETPAFLLKVAKTLSSSDDDQWLPLVRSAVTRLQGLDSSMSAVIPSQLAAEAAMLAHGKDSALAEQALFESLWLCENDMFVMPYTLVGGLAQRLAAYDLEIARALIEPCFENWSWLFKNDDSVSYQRNPPLAALAVIDPDLALNKLSGLQAHELSQQLSRQYALATAIARSWQPLYEE